MGETDLWARFPAIPIAMPRGHAVKRVGLATKTRNSDRIISVYNCGLHAWIISPGYLVRTEAARTTIDRMLMSSLINCYFVIPFLILCSCFYAVLHKYGTWWRNSRILHFVLETNGDSNEFMTFWSSLKFRSQDLIVIFSNFLETLNETSFTLSTTFVTTKAKFRYCFRNSVSRNPNVTASFKWDWFWLQIDFTNFKWL